LKSRSNAANRHTTSTSRVLADCRFTARFVPIAATVRIAATKIQMALSTHRKSKGMVNMLRETIE
jgi:hypothetical protein